MSQKSAQILSHPRFDSSYCHPDHVVIHNCRMIWVNVINKAVLGIVKLTEEHKEVIRDLNRMLRKHGWEPFYPDFETL